MDPFQTFKEFNHKYFVLKKDLEGVLSSTRSHLTVFEKKSHSSTIAVIASSGASVKIHEDEIVVLVTY